MTFFFCGLLSPPYAFKMVRSWGLELAHKLAASFCEGKAGFVCFSKEPQHVLKENRSGRGTSVWNWTRLAQRPTDAGTERRVINPLLITSQQIVQQHFFCLEGDWKWRQLKMITTSTLHISISFKCWPYFGPGKRWDWKNLSLKAYDNQSSRKKNVWLYVLYYLNALWRQMRWNICLNMSNMFKEHFKQLLYTETSSGMGSWDWSLVPDFQNEIQRSWTPDCTNHSSPASMGTRDCGTAIFLHFKAKILLFPFFFLYKLFSIGGIPAFSRNQF